MASCLPFFSWSLRAVQKVPHEHGRDLRACRRTLRIKDGNANLIHRSADDAIHCHPMHCLVCPLGNLISVGIPAIAATGKAPLSSAQ